METVCVGTERVSQDTTRREEWETTGEAKPTHLHVHQLLNGVHGAQAVVHIIAVRQQQAKERESERAAGCECPSATQRCSCLFTRRAMRRSRSAANRVWPSGRLSSTCACCARLVLLGGVA